MKQLTMIGSSVLLAAVGFANHVECVGTNAGLQRVQVELSANDDASQKAMHFVLEDLANPANEAWIFDANPQDISEISLGYNRTNFAQGHHNTAVKISADADIFGYANATDTEDNNLGHRGKLVLWTGPGDNPQKTLFDIVCRTVQQ